ncbi:FAD-dependent monooxygenase [Xylanimonas sp. McL0601]|uniref:FAD-dependent monooxygenase n=1 Tax=Xylanimonas sp. McL0601 TaxID=3414739 RepID=UPI003CF1FB1B
MSTQTDKHSVIVVGAGPSGLFLAGELAAAGVRTLVLDREPGPAQTPKGNGVVGRAAVELRRRGIFDGAGLRVVRAPQFRFGPLTLRLGLVGSPLHLVAVPQRRLEELLERWAVRQGATFLRGHEVTAFDQDGDGVTVRASVDGSPVALRAEYLVGCDGARSHVRKRLGIDFPGVTSGDISRQARVTLPAGAVALTRDRVEVPGVGALPLFRPHLTERGSMTLAPVRALDPSAPDDVYLVATREPNGAAAPTDELPDDELRASIRRVLGADLPYTTSSSARSVVGNSRHVSRYGAGRVFLAGDAAHVFSAGGSSINAGILDAVDLARTLTAALAAGAGASAVDGYHARRHAANERTLALTRLQHDLEGAGSWGEALRGLVSGLLASRGGARRIGALLEGCRTARF